MVKAEKRGTVAQLPRQVETAVRAADAKQAENIVVLDLRQAAGFTDYFIICTGTNIRQNQAIADELMVMYLGRPVEQGPKQVIFDAPRHLGDE